MTDIEKAADVSLCREVDRKVDREVDRKVDTRNIMLSNSEKVAGITQQGNNENLNNFEMYESYSTVREIM